MKAFNFAESKMVERNFYRRYVHVRMRRIIILTVFTVLVTISSLGMRTVYANRVDLAKVELAKADSFCNNAKQELAIANKGVIENKWRAELDKSSRGVLSTANSIMRCAPDDVWLSKVQNLDKSPDVIVEGCASTFASLSRMIGSLRESRLFASVQLSSTRTIGHNAAEPVEFSVRLKMKSYKASALPSQGTQVSGGVPQVERSY